MALDAGTRLGPYEITALIGAGGMGEVYRARDTKLNRDVALKILPGPFTLDGDRIARFRREAHVLASLNHPNIAAIYGFEDSGSTHALVLELVEGPTLADRIVKGPIPLDEALSIAKQLADALEAAHEQGIIHRDLKPANIKLRDDGTVKVLDFGLAKALEPASPISPALTASPTITTPAQMTGIGTLLGTAAYMSPEQAKGRPADKRSDVWAFGCVLYEMLTGNRAFAGEDVSDTLAAVLRGEPDWTLLPTDITPAVVALIKRCLERDRPRRVGDIAVATFVLRDPAVSGAAHTQTTPGSTPRSQLRRVTTLVLVAGLSVGITSALWWSRRSDAALPIVTRFSVLLPDSETFTNPEFRSLAIAPDGSKIAYVANRQLMLRSMSDPVARVLVAETGDAVGNPAFSPDSQSVAFWSGTSGFSRAPGALKKVAVSGGVPVTLCPTLGWSFGISWDATGILFTQPGKGILRVSADGGAPTTVVAFDNPATSEVAGWPSMLPDGETVLFALASLPASVTGMDAPMTTATWDAAQVEIQSLRSGRRQTLFTGGSDPHYVPTGHVVYGIGGNLFARPFALKKLIVTGGPVPVLEGVQRSGIARTGTGAAQVGLSDSGSMVYVAGPGSAASPDRSQLVVVERSGQRTPLKLPTGVYERPRLSPDGHQLAVGLNDGRSMQIWIYDLTGSSPMRQLTFDGNNRLPVWTPDGERLAFTSDRDGDLGIFWQRSDGTTRAERLTTAEAGSLHSAESWSHDGARLLFTSIKTISAGAQRHTLSSLDLKRREVSPFSDVLSYRLISPDFSPDGRWIAYTVATGPNNQVFVQPFPATGTGVKVLVGNGARPQWSPDGKELFFYNGLNGNKSFVVSVRTQPTFAVIGNPVELPANPYGARGPGFGRDTDVFPDGQRFIVALPLDTTSASAGPRQMNIVLNWFEELKQRVPVK